MKKEWVQPSPAELKKMVRDLILRHPERHDQSIWVGNAFGAFTRGSTERIARLLARRKSIPDSPQSPDELCGTTACVAGWACILGSPPGTFVVGSSSYVWDTHLLLPDGREAEVDGTAQELLGLHADQADWLFAGNRTRDEVLDGLARLIDDPDAVLEEDGE